MIYIYITFICIVPFYQMQCDANPTIHGVLNTELKIVKLMGNRMQHLGKFVSNIERKITELLSLKWSPVDRADYISNPLSAMTMVRRLVRDWAPLTAMLGSVSKLHHLHPGDVQWPTESDFEEAARSMMRSQMTYNLKTTMLGKGILSDTFLTNVTVVEHLEMAIQYFTKGLFTETIEWLQHALLGSQYDDVVLRETVLYYMAAALCFYGDKRGSINILRDILKENPRSNYPEQLAEFYDIMASKRCAYEKGSMDQQLKKIYLRSTNLDTLEYLHESEQIEKHSRLCRGEGKIDHNLRCRYLHYHQPHLRFQPFKLEELHLDPPVVRFYDLITDKEAKSLITEAKELSEPALVGGGQEFKVSDYRTSKVAWLEADDWLWLDRKIAEVTRLDPFRGEYTQVSWYSVSGEYLPHYDYFAKNYPWKENRIATLMVYLNDVEQGGNTIFTKWNLSVPPVKNSALLWFNFKPNGKLEVNSEHSGCPVLKGTKWVTNKWFFNFGNDVNFPCTLDQNGSFKGFYL